MRIVSALSFKAWVRYLGASAAGAELVASDNELILQVISLLIAFYALHRERGIRAPWASFRALWPRPRWGAEVTAQWVSTGLVKGFLGASALVSASLFLGFSTVEWPVWSWAWVWNFLPPMLMESFGLVLWVVLFDNTLRFLDECLHAGSQKKRFEGQLLTMVVGAHLLFRILNGSPHLFDRAFTALFAALVSSAYLLWIESSSLLHGSQERAMCLRLSFVMGFLLSWVHLYEQVLGGTRSLSVLTVLEGPVLEPTGSLANAGLVGECLALLACVVGINHLLRRVLKQGT